MNEFNECKQCGECCSTPCDLIPSDLPPLLSKFKMGLSEFFKQYLIALLIASPSFSDQILMMVPVRVDAKGNRTNKCLADLEYLNTSGKCIFLKNNTCLIHDVKPFGGKYLICQKMTESVSIQLHKNHCFAHWKNNQQIFRDIFPEHKKTLSALQEIFGKMNQKNKEYANLRIKRDQLISEELFLLFNKSKAINGYNVLIQ